MGLFPKGLCFTGTGTTVRLVGAFPVMPMEIAGAMFGACLPGKVRGLSAGYSDIL